MRVLLRLAEALQPPSVKGRDWKQRAHLYVLRLGCLLAFVLFPAFGVFYAAAEPDALDPWWLRGLATLSALAVFVWSFRSEWLRERAVAFQVSLACGTTAWVGWLLAVNGLGANYAVGYLSVCVGVALLLSVGFERAGPLALYLCFAGVVTGTVVWTAPVGGASPLVLVACLLIVSALVYVAVSARTQMQQALEEREAQLAEAQRTAGLGNWEWDAATDRSVWSQVMFGLLGLDPDRDAPSLDLLTGHVHFDDRPSVLRYFADLQAGREPADLTVRIGRAD
ncbi:MAG TPA: hypothetical protein VK610_02905, partial [Rhodothermales bacterium]|nr:hypothetical protein [Rhodothermales bacterium]